MFSRVNMRGSFTQAHLRATLFTVYFAFALTPARSQAVASGATQNPAAPAPIMVTQEQEQSVAEGWGKSTTPGVELKFEETKRVRLKGSTAVNYRLLSKGFPPGRIYAVWVKDSFGKSVTAILTGFSADLTGEVVCPDERADRPQSNVTRWCSAGALKDQGLGVLVYKKGEPYDLGVISTDGTVRAFAHVIPFPIEAADGPCRLSVEMADWRGLLFGIYGDGFEPNAQLQGLAVSGKETLNSTVQSPPDGRFLILSLPATKGKKSGTTTFTLIGKTCRVSVTYDWGRAALKVQ